MTDHPEQVQATPEETAYSLVTQIIIGDPQHDMQALEDLQGRGTALALEPMVWITESICLRAFLAEIAVQRTIEDPSLQQAVQQHCAQVWRQLAGSSDALRLVHNHLEERLPAYRRTLPDISDAALQKPPDALSAAFAGFCGKEDNDIRTFIHLDFTLTLGAMREYLESIVLVE